MTEVEEQILSNQVSIMGALGILINRPDIPITMYNMATEDLMARTQETQKIYLKAKEEAL